jgi:LacI family transcriptional regulator
MQEIVRDQSILRQSERRFATPPGAPLRVGVFVEHHSQYGRDLLCGIARYANAVGPWQLDVPPTWYLPPYHGIAEWVGDGVIAQVQSEPFARYLASRTGVPVVDVNGSVPDIPFAQVIVDGQATGALAAQKAIALGHERFAFLGDDEFTFSEKRYEGYARVIEAVFPGNVCSKADQKSIDLLRWAVELPKPVAILAANDHIAREFLALLQGHVPVPEAISVIGVDNDPVEVELASPRLTSVALPVDRVGYEAARLLHQLMDEAGGTGPTEASAGTVDRHDPVRLLLAPLDVVERASTAIAVSDPLVAEALHLIKSLAPVAHLDVEHLADQLAVSRRTLERRFRSTLGRPVLAEIHRARVDRARGMLAHTVLPLEEVATACGFGSLRRFTIAFHNITGLTPGKFRREQR